MSTLRPECGAGTTPSPPQNVIWSRLYRAVRSRRSLAYGKLHDNGQHCAMGCYWEDNFGSVPTAIIDEVAAVNDSIPPTSPPSVRRRHVLKWLAWKLEMLGIEA